MCDSALGRDSDTNGTLTTTSTELCDGFPDPSHAAICCPTCHGTRSSQFAPTTGSKCTLALSFESGLVALPLLPLLAKVEGTRYRKVGLCADRYPDKAACALQQQQLHALKQSHHGDTAGVRHHAKKLGS